MQRREPGPQSRSIEGIPSVPSIVSLFVGFCEVEVGGDGPRFLPLAHFAAQISQTR